MSNYAPYGYTKQNQEDNAKENIMGRSNILLKETERVLNEALEENGGTNPLVDLASVFNQGAR